MLGTTYTYRVTDERARVVELPMGKLIRHLGMDNHVRGVPDESNPEWVARLHGGFVRATLLEQLPTSFGVTSVRGERAFALAHSPPAGYRRPQRKQRPLEPARWLLTGSDGQHRRVANLAQFCQDHNLSADRMYDVASERQKTHRGWKVQRLT